MRITDCRATVISFQVNWEKASDNFQPLSHIDVLWEGNQKSRKSGDLPKFFDDFIASADGAKSG